MLAIDNLKKHFGFVKAVDNVNLDIAEGERVRMEKKIFVCLTQTKPKMMESTSEKKRAAGINISRE